MDIKNNILETIGNTPIIRLNKITRDFPCPVVAKVDYFNPGNSIKDRMAVKMIEVAEKEGKLKPGGTIIEGTSGNTGMGLALVAIVKGYKCIFATTENNQKKSQISLKPSVQKSLFVRPTLNRKIPAVIILWPKDWQKKFPIHFIAINMIISQTGWRIMKPPGLKSGNRRMGKLHTWYAQPEPAEQ